MQARRHRIGAVVGLVLPPGSGHRRCQDHRDVLGHQAVGHMNGVPSTPDDDAEAFLLRPCDRVVDLCRAIGRDHDRNVPVDDRDHRQVAGVAAHLLTGHDRIAIRPGFREEVLELLNLLLVARRGLGRLAEPAAAEPAEPARVGVGPVHVERRGRLHRHLLPAPPLKGERGGHAGHQPAVRRRERGEHTGRARRADMTALGIDGHVGAHIRIEIAQFVDVVGDIDRPDLRDPHRAEGVDQAGIYVLARRIDHAGAGREVHVGTDRGDQPVLEQDRPVLDHAAGDRVNGGALQGHRPGLRRHGHPYLRPEGRRRHRPEERDGHSGQAARARQGSHHRSSLRLHRLVSV